MTKFSVLLTTALFTPLLFAATPQENIKASMAIVAPTMQIEEITETPVAGIYQIVSGPTILYSDASGKYVFEGSLYRLDADKQFTDLTAERREKFVQKTLSTVDPKTFITFAAPHEKTYITVFTDIDCGYCRELHKEVPELNKAGITVRYMAFPRVPQGQPSFVKAQSVWCAEDRQAALTAAKQGKEPAAATCQDPVLAHQQIGHLLQFSGTPVIIFKNGKVVPGYVPVKNLIPMAEKES